MWDDLSSWLSGIAWPIVKKVMAALGLGTLTFEGLSAFGSQIQNSVVELWGQMGGSMLNILALGGITTAIGIILSAIAARIVIIAFGKIALVGSS